jgi:hypothetical protein
MFEFKWDQLDVEAGSGCLRDPEAKAASSRSLASSSAVIASRRRSNPGLRRRLDCFATLAMTTEEDARDLDEALSLLDRGGNQIPPLHRADPI